MTERGLIGQKKREVKTVKASTSRGGVLQGKNSISPAEAAGGN